MELSLARGMKGNKKDLYRHIISKRMTRDNVGLLRNGSGDLVFTGKTSHQLLRPVGKCRARKAYPQWGRMRLGNI